MSTFQQKLRISLGSAALFALINLPATYKLTNNLLPFNLYNETTNCPTSTGLLVHTVVFFLVTLVSMSGAYIDQGTKIKHSLYGSLIFFFISSPAMYSFVGGLFGSNFADFNGCPTLYGVLLHAFVYAAALVGVMYLP